MEDFDPATSFGASTAARYDDDARGDEDAAVRFLAELAGDGAALEFAIGTGRIALPLTAAGVHVEGIELSPDMAEVLRNKADHDLAVTMGDMSVADAPSERYAVVYLVYNTITNLLTQDGQVRCFENAARHLAENGVFVLETGTGWEWAGRRELVAAEQVGADHVVLDTNRFDPATGILEENHIRIGTDGIQMGPIVQRIAPPAELDLMARIAGLKLVERYGWWDRREFNSDSASHISVYARA